jgi:ketosteroid isomerase-like protein
MEQEILDLEQQWVTALLNGDADILERLYADGIVYTHTNATTDTKASYVAKLRSGNLTYQSLERAEIAVRIFGATALATCRWMAKSVAGGINYQIDARYIHVYAQLDGEWKMVAHQSTRIV